MSAWSGVLELRAWCIRAVCKRTCTWSYYTAAQQPHPQPTPPPPCLYTPPEIPKARTQLGPITLIAVHAHTYSPPTAPQWHDNLWLLRHLFFLFLPLLLHLLPRAAPPQSPVPLLATAHLELRQTKDRLSTVRFVHAATQREPTLRAAAAGWWDRQRVEGEWARADEHVRHAAEKLGKSIAVAGEPDGAASGSGTGTGEPGRLRQKVQAILRQMMESVALVPGPAAAAVGAGR